MAGAILGSVANVFRWLMAYRPKTRSIPANVQVALWLALARKTNMDKFAAMTVPHTAHKMNSGG